ncbi:MAG: DEAD/DEAH box helicase [Desulfobulbaceae bacterium]|nr:DEAD/DEAH box helicase [Desulfobulbaceae bacterium]
MNPIQEYISALKGSPRFSPLVAAHQQSPLELQVTRDIPENVPSQIRTLIKRFPIAELYEHQARAVDLIIKGHNVLVATPTASGKSLIYNIPVFSSFFKDPSKRALYIFPLKALSQDQLRVIDKMASLLPADFPFPASVPAAIYDGDTTPHFRRRLRNTPPNILITTPDMLNPSMLAHHDKWSHFFRSLSHVIIDEVHTYRGVFGSHTAWIIRRLKRICRHYGSDPVFVLSSATIGNPLELGRSLIDADLELIAHSGAPRSARNLMLLNPLNSSPYTCATLLLDAALRRNLRTIVFTPSRKMTELITMNIRRRLPGIGKKVSSYRSGFLPEDRRQIEADLATGRLLGVISTSALELGVDIGNLDICILVGYPGSMMATHQRSGRVGRAGRESLTMLVAQQDALDQYFMRNPAEFFNRSVEPVVLDPHNEEISAAHLLCAAAEIPLSSEESLMSENQNRHLVDQLTAKGKLLLSHDGIKWYSARKFPQRSIDLRGTASRYAIREKKSRNLLEELDAIRIFKECHPGAVYFHKAAPWLVELLDTDLHEILVREAHNLSYFTRPTSEKTTEIIDVLDECAFNSTKVGYGKLRVTEVVTGFRKYQNGSQKLLDTVYLRLPPQTFETRGFWLELPPALQRMAEDEQLHFMGGIHAMEHALIAMLPLHVLCDRNDIGGIADPWHHGTHAPTVFVYDGYSGGIGLCKKAFAVIGKLLTETLTAVQGCRCERGCPSCVHSPKCGSGNRPIDKNAAVALLDAMVNGAPGTKGIVVPERIASTKGRPLSIKSQEKEPGQENVFTLPEKYGVFDLETRLSAQEVGGWHRADKMRVSVAVLYDNEHDEFVSYLEDEIPALLTRLAELDLVVGFNNKRFDNLVLSAYTKRDLNLLPNLDILEEVYTLLGYRLSLDRLAKHTLGTQKNGNGLLALQWFKEGKMDQLRDYCRQDVAVTRDLFLFGIEHHHLLFQNKAGQKVRLPVSFHEAVRHLIRRSL